MVFTQEENMLRNRIRCVRYRENNARYLYDREYDRVRRNYVKKAINDRASKIRRKNIYNYNNQTKGEFMVFVDMLHSILVRRNLFVIYDEKQVINKFKLIKEFKEYL